MHYFSLLCEPPHFEGIQWWIWWVLTKLYNSGSVFGSGKSARITLAEINSEIDFSSQATSWVCIAPLFYVQNDESIFQN